MKFNRKKKGGSALGFHLLKRKGAMGEGGVEQSKERKLQGCGKPVLIHKSNKNKIET